MSFLPGFREDCSYQQQQFTDLECPVGILDSDFRNPDLDRYAGYIFENEPRVDIVGDAYDAAEARSYVEAIREVVEAHGWNIHITDSTLGGVRFEITGIEFVDG